MHRVPRRCATRCDARRWLPPTSRRRRYRKRRVRMPEATTSSRTLSGKVALVTGGSRGIGAAIARRLAHEGADVVISYTASADKAAAVVRELEAAGRRAAAFKADQADPAQVEFLVKAVVEHFGRLDILINNAGVFVMG